MVDATMSHAPGGYSMMADRTLDIMISAPVHLILIVAFLYMAWVVTPPRIRKQLGVQAATPMPPSISPAHRQMWSVSPTRQDANEVSDAESPSPKQSPVLSRRKVQPLELLSDTPDFLHDDNRVLPTWSAEDFDARRNGTALLASDSDNDARGNTEGARSTGGIAMHKVQRQPATRMPAANVGASGDAHAAARTIQSAWRSSRNRRLSYNATGHAGKSHSPASSRRPSMATTLGAAAANSGVTTATASVAAEVETDALLRDLKRRGSFQEKTGRPVISRGSVGVSSGGLRTSPAKVSSQHRRARAATIALRGRDSIGLSGDEPVQRRPVDASPWRRFGSRVVDNDGSAGSATTNGNGEPEDVGDTSLGKNALAVRMVVTWELMVAGSTGLAGGALAVEFVALLLRWLGLHSRVDALGTIADSILAADAGITCVDAVLTKQHRQPQWAVLLQIIAALRVWMLCEVVESFASVEGTLPARWYKYVRLVRLLALPSVVWRWEVPGNLAGVGTAAFGVLLVVLGVDMVAGALWTYPVDAPSIVFGLALWGAGLGALVALHHAISGHEVQQQGERRMSVVEESLFAHRHTLSARRACVAKAFGPAVRRNEAISGAVAKRFRYEFLPAGSVLHMEKDTLIAVVIEGRLVGESAAGRVVVAAPPNRFLGVVVTPPGHAVCDYYLAKTPAKLYILDLHEIEDLQLECAALRLAIKERRTAHISANNVRHVVAAVKQALWYCLAISVLALGGIVGVVMLVAS